MEWREKARQYHLLPGGPMASPTVVQFKSLFGEPSSTQTVGIKSYWYYQCADGTIQIELANPELTGGQMMIGGINDY
jgi:hypothetical protein